SADVSRSTSLSGVAAIDNLLQRIDLCRTSNHR
ncbi:MAG: hypothetical protein ACI9DC_004906, partial [Gammaproteobacteria bacterium]